MEVALLEALLAREALAAGALGPTTTARPQPGLLILVAVEVLVGKRPRQEGLAALVAAAL